MNYMGEIAAMLGVALGEEFQYNNSTYVLTELGMLQINPGSCNVYRDQAFIGLLTGAHSVQLQPFKPKYDQAYYIVDNDGSIVQETWLDTYIDVCNYKLGNCYRTQQEAMANQAKWLDFYNSDKIVEV